MPKKQQNQNAAGQRAGSGRKSGGKGGEATESLKEKAKDFPVGEPFAKSRDVVEEGSPGREGTNLDIGEERSPEQRREKRELEREGKGGSQGGGR